MVAAVWASAQSPSLAWEKTMGSSSGDIGRSIITDGSGNVYTTGCFKGTADFDPGTGTFNLISAGNTDIFISRLNAAGNFVWAKRIGGTLNDDGKSIVADASGNIYVTGYFCGTVDFNPGTGVYNLTSAGLADIFILKLDAAGNFVWAKSMGGISADIGQSLKLDGVGNLIVTGYFRDIVDFAPLSTVISAGGQDIFVAKYDGSGNFVWAKQMGGPLDEWSTTIALDASGNIYTTGAFYGTCDFDPGTGNFDMTSSGNPSANYDIFISKLDASGNFVWAKQMGGTINDVGLSVAVDASGNVYSTGWFQGTADFDPGTGTNYLTAAGSFDIYILKLDASGNFIWVKTIGSGLPEGGASIALSAAGYIYIAGWFYNTVDFDPGPGVFNLTSAGEYDVFILKLNSSGNFVWATRMGGLGSDINWNLSLDASGNIYTTGERMNYTQKGKNGTPTWLGSNVYSLKYSQPAGSFKTSIPDAREEIVSPIALYAYPNPNNGEFKIEIANAPSEGTIEIYNLLGALIHKQKIVNQVNSIDISNEANGLYFIKVISDNNVIAEQKILKQ